MKRYIKFLLLILCITILSGCDSDLDTTNCSLNNKQIDYTIKTTYKITSSKDIVNKVEIKEVIASKDKKKLRSFKEQLTNQYKNNNKLYKGYKYEADLDGDTLTLEVTIDYEKMNLKKFVKDNAAMKKYVNKDNKFTLKGAKELYKFTGARCK